MVRAGDRTRAAIAGRRAADLYGGVILREHLEDNCENYTRFLLLCATSGSPDTADKLSLVFQLDHRPGALHRALEPFGCRNLNLMKIDVDGHELPVLQGASETLRRFRPILVMEMSPYIHAEHSNSFVEFVALLKSLSYSLCDADTGVAVPLDVADQFCVRREPFGCLQVGVLVVQAENAGQGCRQQRGRAG